MEQEDKERILKMSHSSIDGMQFGRDKTYKKVCLAKVLSFFLLYKRLMNYTGRWQILLDRSYAQEHGPFTLDGGKDGF